MNEWMKTVCVEIGQLEAVNRVSTMKGSNTSSMCVPESAHRAPDDNMLVFGHVTGHQDPFGPVRCFGGARAQTLRHRMHMLPSCRRDGGEGATLVQ
jgi:hypothetical protein